MDWIKLQSANDEGRTRAIMDWIKLQYKDLMTLERLSIKSNAFAHHTSEDGE